MFDLEPTLLFLKSQPVITTWHHLNANSCPYDPSLLPQLSNAAIPSWLLPTFHSRNITRLHTAIKFADFIQENQIINNFTGYGQTLVVLVLERSVVDGCMMSGDFIIHLARNLPHLETLYLWHRGELVSFFFTSE